MKKGYSQLISITFLVFTLITLVQCKKNNPASSEPPTPPPHNGYSTTLWDKPVDTLNYYLNGKWRVHFNRGGICGCKQSREQYNEYYEFIPSQQIVKYYYQNTINRVWDYDWKSHVVHPLTPLHNVMTDKNAAPTTPPLLPTIFEPVRIVNDTLVVNGLCSYMPDNMEAFMTKE